MGNKGIIKYTTICAAVLFHSCTEKPDPKRPSPVAKPSAIISLVETPEFSGDSAYAFVQKQVDFGPRVPNTEAHKACAVWLEDQLVKYGFEVLVQEATVTTYNKKELEIFNIMGQYNPSAADRILLCAHWDTRPYADRDTKNKTQPIDGANDGGSGVGVLLEIARLIKTAEVPPSIGVDILFFDAEDYGKPESAMLNGGSDSWCLGSQYWSRNIPIPDYKPKYGILLDMVGASNAVFPKEAASVYYARDVVEKVWNIAHAMGHKAIFSPIAGNPITDDHIYLNTIAGIPTIDIIHYEVGRSDFGSFHHTHEDNMDIIDANTLKVVGDVMMQVIYQE